VDQHKDEHGLNRCLEAIDLPKPPMAIFHRLATGRIVQRSPPKKSRN